MLMRLTGPMRLRAGWTLAFIYMLCVLASGVSFAFADGSRVAHCLADDGHVWGVVHVHEGKAVIAATHLHGDGHVNDQADRSIARAVPDLGNAVKTPASYETSAAAKTSVPAEAPHKSSDGQCCGLICSNALPSGILEIVRPSVPRSLCAAVNYRNVADSAPPRLYRPPIT
jgi:hypothetical protein